MIVDITHLPEPVPNSIQPVFCAVCGCLLALRYGGGAVRGGDTPAELQARVDLHDAWHRSLVVRDGG